MRARYNRISTPNQNIERQLIKKLDNEVLYNDVISGAIEFNKRPKGIKLLDDIKSKKIKSVSVSSIDRLGRSTIDILQTLDFFNNNHVNLRVDNLGLESIVNDKPNSVFKLIVSVLANVSEMERQTLRERQLEGIAIAKAKGTYKGRIRGSKESVEDFLSKHKEVVKYLKKQHSLRDVVKLTNVSLGTVQKVKKLMI